MNGQLIFLLISMLMQNPAGDVFPSSKGLGPVSPSTFPASAPVLPNENPSEQCKVGYGTDSTDGKFCMIIQIAPQSIAAFSDGRMGKELTAQVPTEIRSRVEKVIVRIGTGPVERVPPNPNKLSESRPTGDFRVTNLDNRSPVTIDSPNSSSFLPVGGQYGSSLGAPGNMPNNILPNNNLPNNNTVNNNFLNNNPANNGSHANGSGHNDASVFPNSHSTPVHPNSNLDRSLPVNTYGGTGAFDAQNGNTGLPNNVNARNNEAEQFGMPAPSTSYPRDDFTSKASPYYNPIKPNPANSNYASNGYPSNTGNFAPGSSRPYSPIANNSNPLNGTNVNPTNGYEIPNSQPQSYLPSNNLSPPPLSPTQQYGALPLQQPSPYSTVNQYPVVPSTSMAGFASPRTNGNPSTGLEVLPEDPALAKDKLLPFLLLFSIVGNVYLGLWMNHLRGRYRQLLSNMRGIPASDLG